MKASELWDMAIKAFLTLGGGGVLMWLLGRRDVQKEQYLAQIAELIAECKRREAENLLLKADGNSQGLKIDELRAAFHRLQESHIPQATENSLMRIRDRRAIESLKYALEAVEKQDYATAGSILTELARVMSDDIVLAKIPPL